MRFLHTKHAVHTSLPACADVAITNRTQASLGNTRHPVSTWAAAIPSWTACRLQGKRQVPAQQPLMTMKTCLCPLREEKSTPSFNLGKRNLNLDCMQAAWTSRHAKASKSVLTMITFVQP